MKKKKERSKRWGLWWVRVVPAPERENTGQNRILPAGSQAPWVHPPARGVRRGVFLNQL